MMREISWGRTLFHNPDGTSLQYSQLGLYGKLVHPLVGILLILLVIFLIRAKVWTFIKKVRIPLKSFILLLLFIFLHWCFEHGKTFIAPSEVGEELAEFGAYMMMLFLLEDAVWNLKNKSERLHCFQLFHKARLKQDVE